MPGADIWADRATHQVAVGDHLRTIQQLNAEAVAAGLYPDGLTSELANVEVMARVSAPKLAPPPEPEPAETAPGEEPPSEAG